MIDNKEFNTVAQLSHFGGGLAVIFGSIVLFGASSMWWSILILAILTFLKEFWYDFKYETPEVRGSSKLDFVMYMVGAGTAVLSVWIKSLL